MRTFILSATAAAALFATALSAQAMVPTQAQMQKYCPETTHSINCSIPAHAFKSTVHKDVRAFAIPSAKQDMYKSFKERDARASYCAGDGELDCPR